MKRVLPWLVVLVALAVPAAAETHDARNVASWRPDQPLDQARQDMGAAYEAIPEPREPSFEMAQRGDFYPLEKILNAIERRYPGHQLSVSGPSQSGDGYVYRIKWLTDEGAVLYITADAHSGAIQSVDGG